MLDRLVVGQDDVRVWGPLSPVGLLNDFILIIAQLQRQIDLFLRIYLFLFLNLRTLIIDLLLLFFRLVLRQLIFILVVVKAEGVSREFESNQIVLTEVVEHVLVDEFVLTRALHHAVSLLPQPPHDAEDGDPGDVLGRHFSLQLEQNVEALDNVIDGQNGTGPADASAAVQDDFTVDFLLLEFSLE